MRVCVTSVLLVLTLLFASSAAADVRLSDKNSVVVFRFELTKCIVNGVIYNADDFLRSDFGVYVDQDILVLEYKEEDRRPRPALYLDFQIRNSGPDLFSVSGGIQIAVYESGISSQFETRSLSLNSLHLAPLVGVLTNEDLLSDSSIINIGDFNASKEIVVVLSLRLSGGEKNSDVTFVFEKEPHERGTMKDRFSYKFYYGSFRNREYDSLGLFLDDLVVVYRDETRLFTLSDFLIESKGIMEATPAEGMSTVFANSCGGRSSGKLSLLTYDEDEVINSQYLFLDSYSSWEFKDVDNKGIAEILVRHLGFAHSICSADRPWYERLVVWRENVWVTDSPGEFPDYYAEKCADLEKEMTKHSVVDDKLLVYYAYYMLMVGRTAEEVTALLEQLVDEHTLVVRNAYDSSREQTIDSAFVQEVLKDVLSFSIESWY